MRIFECVDADSLVDGAIGDYVKACNDLLTGQ